MKKFVSLLIALVMMLTMTFAMAEDWSADTDWMSIDWDTKTACYQFTGTWELLENNFRYQFLINLYDDGSVVVDQFNALGGYAFKQFGFWSEEADEDGNCINLVIVRSTPVAEGDALVPHEYEYALYEEADGGYSFGYDFGIVPGAYYRTVDMTGTSEIVYESLATFEAAVNEVAE